MDREKVEELYKNSFPENERIPLWFLLCKKELIDYISFYDDEVFVGYSYLITNKNLTFVLYLRMDTEMQGSTLLSMDIHTKYWSTEVTSPSKNTGFCSRSLRDLCFPYFSNRNLWLMTKKNER